MTKKHTIKESQNEGLNGSEAAVMRRIGNGGDAVGAVVEGLRSEAYKTDESVKALRALQKSKRIAVEEARPYSSLGAYVWSPLSLWFWAALGAVVLSMALISVTSGVVLYLRYVFGSALILFLPGYALVEALYPKRGKGPQVERVGLIKAEMDDDLTRFALSIGLSLAIVPLTGLVLNYTPFGIRLLPVTLSIAGITIALLTLALTRKHAYYKLAKGVL